MIIRNALVPLLALITLSGCEPNGNFQSRLTEATRLREEASRQSETVPYRDEQHRALKAYFTELNLMALALKEDSRLVERYNQALRASELGELCTKVFFTKASWKAIMERCTQSDFFLCAEEVRAYPLVVTALRELLAADVQGPFDQAEACRAVLE